MAHGVAIRTDRFYVSYFPVPGTDPAYTAKAEFTIYGLDAVEDTAYYGTGNARVVALGIDSETRWSTVIAFPVIRLMAVPELDQVLVSDEKGGLALLLNTSKLLAPSKTIIPPVFSGCLRGGTSPLFLYLFPLPLTR